MWYAISSKPLTMALVSALLANMTVAGAGFFAVAPTVHVVPDATAIRSAPLPVKPKVTDRAFPASFCQPVTLPSQYRFSERGALEYLAKALHVGLRFTGPDYAMIGEHVPYDRPVPARELLLRIVNIPYIRGSFMLMGDKLMIVHNASLDD